MCVNYDLQNVLESVRRAIWRERNCRTEKCNIWARDRANTKNMLQLSFAACRWLSGGKLNRRRAVGNQNNKKSCQGVPMKYQWMKNCWWRILWKLLWWSWLNLFWKFPLVSKELRGFTISSLLWLTMTICIICYMETDKQNSMEVDFEIIMKIVWVVDNCAFFKLAFFRALKFRSICRLSAS